MLYRFVRFSQMAMNSEEDMHNDHVNGGEGNHHLQINPQHRPHGIIQPLLTDLYQITMAYAYWRAGKKDDIAVFDLFFRKCPFGGEITIFGGLEECLKFVENFEFTEQDVAYLRRVLPATTDPRFFDYLLDLRTDTLTIHAIAEGTVVFPREPLLRVEGPLPIAQLLETTLLTLVNYASLVATNAARFRQAAGPNRNLLEFGLRRAQGPDGGLSASKYVYIGGFDGTSNVLAGMLFDIPVRGTHAHAYISSFGGIEELHNTSLADQKTGVSVDFAKVCIEMRKRLLPTLGVADFQVNSGEFAGFIAYALSFPTSFLALIDTYDSLKSGLPNFCIVAAALAQLGYRPVGIRLDSGDLAYLSRKVREMFKKCAGELELPWFASLLIVASNDINEETIYSLNEQGHTIDSFGIGTHLVTCQSQPALGGVYKLVMVNESPRMKLSEEGKKVSIPGRKRLFRLYGAQGVALLDLMTMTDETDCPRDGHKTLCRHPLYESKRCYATPVRVEELLVPYWRNGRRVRAALPIEQVKRHVAHSLQTIRDDHQRRLNPTPYKVSLSCRMYDYFHQLWLDDSPIGELM